VVCKYDMPSGSLGLLVLVLWCFSLCLYQVLVLTYLSAFPKMTISIVGDLNLSQLLILPRFRTVLNYDYVFCPSSNMASFAQYKTLLPVGTRYLVVGCLGPLLGDRIWEADVALSKLGIY
jgi:hypothetical protein